MATIRVSLNEDVERLLEDLKQDYPALDYPEPFKLALSELHRRRILERSREQTFAPIEEVARRARARGEADRLSDEEMQRMVDE